MDRERSRDIERLLFKLPCSKAALIFKGAEVLQGKFNLQYCTITIHIGSIQLGVTDVKFEEHFKKKDILKELDEIYQIEKELDGV